MSKWSRYHVSGRKKKKKNGKVFICCETTVLFSLFFFRRELLNLNFLCENDYELF